VGHPREGGTLHIGGGTEEYSALRIYAGLCTRQAVDTCGATFPPALHGCEVVIALAALVVEHVAAVLSQTSACQGGRQDAVRRLQRRDQEAAVPPYSYEGISVEPE
jgi:hypothetical protein